MHTVHMGHMGLMVLMGHTMPRAYRGCRPYVLWRSGLPDSNPKGVESVTDTPPIIA